MTTVPPPDPTPSTPGVPAGWYPDATTGRTRWWNGAEWTNDFAPPPAAPVHYAPVAFGQVYQQIGYPRPEPTGNGPAVAGFVLGLVALAVRIASRYIFGGYMVGWIGLGLLIILTILAIVFGAVGIARSRRVGRGLPLAIIGLVLGVLQIALLVANLLFGFSFFF